MINQQIIGFSTVDSTSKNSLVYGIEAVKTDLLNEFMTPQGARKMLPTYGSIAWWMIYEPLTSDIKQQLSDDCTRIVENDPRVTLTDINITEEQNGFVVSLQLKYTPQDLDFDLLVNFQQSNLEG